jgi:hypothetical protein
MKKLIYFLAVLCLWFGLLGCGGGGGNNLKDNKNAIDIYKKIEGRYKSECIKDGSKSFIEYIILNNDKSGEIRRATFNGEICSAKKIDNHSIKKITFELKDEIEDKVYKANIKFTDSGEMFYTVIKIEDNNITVAFFNSDQDGNSEENRVTLFINSEVLNKIDRNSAQQQLKEQLEGNFKSDCINDALNKSHYAYETYFENEVGSYQVFKFNSNDCSGIGSTLSKTLFVYKIGNLIKDINNEEVFEYDETIQNQNSFYSVLKYKDGKLYIAKENGVNDGSSQEHRANDISNSYIFTKE